MSRLIKKIKPLKRLTISLTGMALSHVPMSAHAEEGRIYEMNSGPPQLVSIVEKKERKKP